MSDYERRNIAGMSMKGGRKDQFFLCLLEFFPEKNRWFLHSLLQVKDEKGIDGDDAIRSWIDKYEINQMVFDFPLSDPACQSCKVDCPGVDKCEKTSVKVVRELIDEIIEEDTRLHEMNPKEYERKRNTATEVDYSRDIFSKVAKDHILSKSFKRRLRKGYLPYWNRPIDFWIWSHYYDQLLDLFNQSYDSFGNTSLMLQSRFAYLRRHFPDNLTLFEGNLNICLIELLRAGVIRKRDIKNLNDMELWIEARLDIIKEIEKTMNIFIYDHDLELLVKNPRAFDSFMMAVVGQNRHMDKSRELADWTYPSETNFIVPAF